MSKNKMSLKGTILNNRFRHHQTLKFYIIIKYNLDATVSAGIAYVILLYWCCIFTRIFISVIIIIIIITEIRLQHKHDKILHD